MPIPKPSKRGLLLLAAIGLLTVMMYAAIWFMGKAAKQNNVMRNVLEAELGNLLGPEASILHPPDDINKDNAQDLIGVVRSELSDSLGHWVYFTQLAVIQVEKRKAFVLLRIDPNGYLASGKPLVPAGQTPTKAPYGYRCKLTRNAVTFTYDFEVQSVDSLGNAASPSLNIFWDKQNQTYALQPA